ncbi:MAG: hypothetical protein P8J25_02600 [Porticoccaceae bacterium]|nr:hypothetical protein [Porticoccaceae bacterium]
MDNKHFKSWSIVALFPLLAACGNDSSESSGEMNIANCNIGNNPIAEGQSCMLQANSTLYTCNSGLVVTSTPQLKPRNKLKPDEKDVVTGTGSSGKLKNEVLTVSTDTDKSRNERSIDAKAIIYCASNPPN